ncbi:MAG: hypothetical protein DI555_09420 [Novosphingobium pentaromativorans]|uniref:DUF4440 domain-containing protein n=1 Tax=Novosphingobium pentaromativorans TaxID=205844 RepID=A0A2W5NT21_9SPHN|nr:MAG: hypothetical protein DI555_09420 [Novosphingobium pentaromativorans]
MTRTSNIFLAAALGCILAPAHAWADVRSDIEVRYEELRVAMESREGARIKPLLAPDFVRTDLGNNTMSADELIAGLAKIPVDPDRKSQTTVQSVSVNGKTAEVVQQQVASDTRQGRDGKMHSFGTTSLSHDTWVQSDKGWLLKTTQAQSTTITRDGVAMRTIKKGDPVPQGRRGRMGPGNGGMMGPPRPIGDN